MGERKTQKPRVQKRAVKNLVDSTEIARRAYQLFLQRGATHGRDVDDWLAAEQELRGN
jgi:Protein of unknown function (DUF2934)